MSDELEKMNKEELREKVRSCQRLLERQAVQIQEGLEQNGRLQESARNARAEAAAMSQQVHGLNAVILEQREMSEQKLTEAEVDEVNRHPWIFIGWS